MVRTVIIYVLQIIPLFQNILKVAMERSELQDPRHAPEENASHRQK